MTKANVNKLNNKIVEFLFKFSKQGELIEKMMMTVKATNQVENQMIKKES
jgi:hypothetical protein